MDYVSRPFFSVFVRTCNRPINNIERAINSVISQTCQDLEIVVAVDKATNHSEGNMMFANGQFDRYKKYVRGLYILAMDDDGFFLHNKFLDIAKKSIVQNDFPGCLIVRSKPAKRKNMQYDSLPCPGVWDTRFELGERPYRWCGNGGNWIARNDIFSISAKEYKHERGGDWYFVTHICELDTRIARCNVIGSSNLGRGYGYQAANESVDWDMLAKKFGFGILKKGNLMRLKL